jgi:peptidoglycan hydrolase CwlO-like protein
MLKRKDFKMSKSLSPLAAMAASLTEARATLKSQKALVSVLALEYKNARAMAKFEKQARADARKATAIAKAQAKLEKLMAPVGAKALKANRKPSKAVVTVPA